MKVLDLKVYEIVTNCTTKFELLHDKLIALDMRLRSKRVFKENKFFWAQEDMLILNLIIFSKYWLPQCADLLIVNIDGSPVVYTEFNFKDSVELLSLFLRNCCGIWAGMPCLVSELKRYYPLYDAEFGAFEYSFLDLWSQIPTAIDELINLLNSWQFSFIYEQVGVSTPYVTLIDLAPKWIYDSVYKDVDFSRLVESNFIELLIFKLFHEEVLVNILDYWIRQKLEYKFRVENLTPEEAINLVLHEILSKMKLTTLQFLAVNPPVNFDKLRKLSVQES